MSHTYSTQTFDGFTLETVAQSIWAGDSHRITTWYRANCRRCLWSVQYSNRSTAYKAGLEHHCEVAA